MNNEVSFQQLTENKNAGTRNRICGTKLQSIKFKVAHGQATMAKLNRYIKVTIAENNLLYNEQH